MKVLVTGGTGYIGSHTAIELLSKGHQVVVLDNLSNSKRRVIDQIQKITQKKVPFYPIDLLHLDEVSCLFQKENIDAVIHFAALKAVGESTREPLRYYQNNVTGTLNLINAMREHRVDQMVFSSSATVYGEPEKIPIKENEKISPTNSYGHTKAMIEQILIDMTRVDPRFKAILLRYFNPIGAHASGEIGEDPNGPPNNLLPFITQVAVGKREKLSIFGNDYPTPDGTGVRDYIHITDLALGHVAALKQLASIHDVAGIYNLGTGKGYSVMEMVRGVEEVSGKKISYEIAPRREGDIPTCYADTSHAEKELGWMAVRDMKKMCEDAWHWQSRYPDGL